MNLLPHRLDRTIVIRARRNTVFSFFTDNRLWSTWWGAGSTIEARPGGRLFIRYPNGIEAAGEVIEVVSPERIVFTFGFASGKPMPPGASRVTIRLEDHHEGTRLLLGHEFTDAATRDEHIQGWRYQLSVFGNVVTDEVNADAATLVDGWFKAWSEPDENARKRMLESIATSDVRFRDRFSLVDGIADLMPHLAAAQRFMPDMRLERAGDVRHCQGVLLVEWVARAGSGEERAKGTNVFVLGPDGRIQSATGFWAAPKPSAG